MKSTQKPNNSFDVNSLADWKDMGEKVLKKASAELKEKTKDLRQKSFNDLSNDMKNYIQSNPLRSVLIAIGAGLALGFFLKRRK